MQAIPPLPAMTFHALTSDERAYLQNWRKLALPAGIDMVEDLMVRPWPCPVADSILGVFRFGEDMAAWLVIGQDGTWVVARCSDGSISEQCGSLAEALSYVHPLEDPV
jgi:hypothetical protein